MFFVEICVNNTFIFSVSAFTVLQSMFLSDSNLIFFSYVTLFKFYKFISSSCVCVCSAWFGYVVFRLLLVYY